MQVVKPPPIKKINREINLAITQFIENSMVSLNQIGCCRAAGQYQFTNFNKDKARFWVNESGLKAKLASGGIGDVGHKYAIPGFVIPILFLLKMILNTLVLPVITVKSKKFIVLTKIIHLQTN